MLNLNYEKIIEHVHKHLDNDLYTDFKWYGKILLCDTDFIGHKISFCNIVKQYYLINNIGYNDDISNKNNYFIR